MKYNKTNADINSGNNSNNNDNNSNLISDIINKKDFNYEDFKRDSIKKLYEGKGLTGKDGVFTSMIKDFLETALKEELSNHLYTEKWSQPIQNWSLKTRANKCKQNCKAILFAICSLSFACSLHKRSAVKISQLDLYFEKRLKLDLK